MEWSVEDRIGVLKLLRAEIVRRGDDICAALSSDLHKNAGEAYATEIGVVLSEISALTSNLHSWLRCRRYWMPIFLPFYGGRVERVAWGRVLIIAPWNYPFQLVMAPLVGAIAGGNSVVVKPSPLAPATQKVVCEIIEAIFPVDRVRVELGGVDVVNGLLAEKWDFMFFTGSVATGKIVVAAAAEHLTPVVLELGGKSPCVVMEGADIGLSAMRIAWGKFLNAGQTCVAPDYVMVDAKIADRLEVELKKSIEKLYGKEPKDSDLYGRIITDSSFDRLMLMCADAVSDRGEKYIAPTVVRVGKSDSLMAGEIFGPLLPIITYDSVDEAVEYINGGAKPLALYVFGAKAAAMRVVRVCDSGSVCVNDVVMQLVSSRLPFGGVGDSGMGVYHGRWSVNSFTRPRSVLIASSIEFKFRYNPLKYIKLIKGVFR